MRFSSVPFVVLFLIFGCRTRYSPPVPVYDRAEAVITFGSCNKSDLENVFWDDILKADPDVFIWGGDIVYADTDNISKLKAHYNDQNKVAGYMALKESVLVTGTWDDHDYGLNDGGSEFTAKAGSQQAFLDFMDVPKDDARRTRNGVYSAQTIVKPEGTVKVINLDTRYFRTALTPDERSGRRYRPGTYGKGTILGEAQWKWLHNELKTSQADFNLIVSSIQFLSAEHGFEKWANHPHEMDNLIKTIRDSGAKGVMILSGDRHISEFSKISPEGLDYPLIDFTSSGLTHSYEAFSGEPNAYRHGEVVSVPSYGLIALNFSTRKVDFKIMGDNGTVLGQMSQQY